ncbi:MAG: pyridoxal phosphate-dependent aminotransferase [Candidatus Bathyarchaeota archaeon]|jgi:aspartate/methionine/tyrosine aminotransferase|nr:pyridoxal phosphate-dependent aminotransferase [Candidatus Bathyarchaeota archaeon]|tara:strand:- start:37 stop:1203 length:1167 start_codon:yes stop_codon:yes gene_type:complete
MGKRWVSKNLKKMEPDPFGELREKIRHMSNVINLSSGDPDFPTPSHIVEAAYRALQDGYTHYTLTSGLPELKEEIAQYQRKFNMNLDPEGEILVTPGSQQALFLTLTSILNNADEVLIPDPSYTVYSPIIKYLGAKPIIFPLNKENNFHIDLTALEKKISPKTKALIICSPNNPTGTVFSDADLETVAAIAIENELLVISDEIYSEFVWKGKHKSIATYPGMKNRTVVIVSFSKTFSMTGWRLGYLIANQELIQMMEGLQANMVICPAGFVQRAGLAALQGSWEPVTSMAQEYERRVDYVVQRLNALKGISCRKPEGAFYVWVDVSALCPSSIDFCNDLLEKKALITMAGKYFGQQGEGFVRLALVKSMDVLTEALDRMDSYINGLET